MEMIKEEQQNIWFAGKDYEKTSHLIQKRNANILAKLHNMEQNLNNIFELGCGTGHLTQELVNLKIGNQIDALDISPDMIRIAKTKKNLENVNFICSSFSDFLPDTKYDAIFSSAAFHWLYPEYINSLNKMYSLLSKQGTIYLATAGKNLNSIAFDQWIENQLAGTFASHDYQPFSPRRLSIDDLEHIISKTEFKIEEAFIVERLNEINIVNYIEWLISSGAFWNINDSEINDLKKFLEKKMMCGSSTSTIKMGHWSLFAVIKKSYDR